MQAIQIQVFVIRKISNVQISPTVTRERQKPKPTVVGGYVMALLPLTAFCLGSWQVKRRKWKVDLIAALEEKTTAPAIPLPADLDEIDNLEYRHVHVRGTFDHTKEIFIGPRSNVHQEEQSLMNYVNVSGGYWVVTPFRLEDRDLTILVNRGWISRAKKDVEKRRAGQINGVVELNAVVRHSEKRGQFSPKTLTKYENEFMRRDIDIIAERVGTAKVYVDADLKSTVAGGPDGGQTLVTLRNEHLQYIMTWYILALITSRMWYKRYRRPKIPDTAEYYVRTIPK